MTDRVNAAVQPDGGLYNLGWYLGWNVGSDTATLDGVFTADDLEAIAAHMRERHSSSSAAGAALP